MLILHPKSTCDVCFDSYVSSERVPYVIKCGHILCEECIDKLPSPTACPFCRMPFDKDEEQLRLHIDTATNALSTPLLMRRSEISVSEAAAQAQRYLSRITDIVLGGAKASEVRDLINEVEDWFADQDEEFRELQTAWLLLKKHSQKKSDLRQCLEDKKTFEQEVQFQKELNSTLQGKLEYYKSSNMSYEEQLSALQKEHDRLLEQYKYAMKQYQEQTEEIARLKSGRKASPPMRPLEARYNAREHDSDAMAISLPKEKVMDPDMFTLSPVPASASIAALKSTAPRFRPLTEESDTEDLRPSAYTMRSIQPINIKSHREIYRKPSIDSQDMDVSSRSLPRSSMDVQMASCSSSPVVSGFQHGSSRDIAGPSSSSYRDRDGRRPSVSRRPTLDSPAEEIGEEEIVREQSRQRLQEILTSPAIMTSGMPSVETRRHSPESHSIPHTRNTSPVSRGPSAAPNVISSASTAAQQAERERQERNRAKDPTQQSQYSSTSFSSQQQYRDYNRDLMQPQPTMPQRPQYTRRGSESGSFRGKSNSVSSMSGPMSNLSKSIRANHDGQRGQ